MQWRKEILILEVGISRKQNLFVLGHGVKHKKS